MSNIKTFSSVKNHAYRMYFGGLIGHMAGMNMQMIARALLVYRLTGSALILGSMSLANALPMLLLSLFGGAIADRVQKKYILTIGQASSALVSFGVALALTFSYLSAEREGSWWILIIASALQGSIMGLMMPARQAIVPEIVGEEQIMNAMALNNFGMNIFRLLSLEGRSSV
jgi:MFS family permease